MFSVSGAIKTAAGPKLDAELMTLGGCRPGEAKTTLGMTLSMKPELLKHNVHTSYNSMPIYLLSYF